MNKRIFKYYKAGKRRFRCGQHYHTGRKNYRSQIYLGKENIKKGIIRPEGKLAYTVTFSPDKIFIGTEMKHADKWKEENLSRVLTHEELHNLLVKLQDEETSRKLDNISVPVSFMDEKHRQIINPKTASTLNPKFTKILKTAEQIEGQNV